MLKTKKGRRISIAEENSYHEVGRGFNTRGGSKSPAQPTRFRFHIVLLLETIKPLRSTSFLVSVAAVHEDGNPRSDNCAV
jgi:hypothetical protein